MGNKERGARRYGKRQKYIFSQRKIGKQLRKVEEGS